MLRPSHAAPQYSASEVFTDREDARARFAQALEDDQALDAYRVLVWYGVGGQGKSALQAEFGRIVDRRRGTWVNVRKRPIGQAVLDLELIERRSPVQAMLTLRLQLGESAGLGFPAFDTAFARYFALDNPGKDIRALHPQLFQSGGSVLNDVLSLATDAASIIPGYALLAKYGSKLLASGAEKLHDWWRLRGVEVLAGLDDLSQDALASRLPSYLGADLCDAMRRPAPPRFVIRIDTHEALWRERGLKDGPGALLADDWVRRLVQDTPGALFVITGRDRLRWGEIEPAWDEVLEQHLLGGLSTEDAESFLTKVGVDDPAVRAVIASAAGADEGGGCLPYFLDLEKDSWHAIRGTGRTPMPADFGGTRAQILARFLNHLDPETERVLHLASYGQTLEAPILELIGRTEAAAGSEAPNWRRVLERAMVDRSGDGPPMLHLLMRQALQARELKEEPERYRRIHRALVQAYARIIPDKASEITQAHEGLLLTAIEHGLAADWDVFDAWVTRALGVFRDAAHWRAVERGARRLGSIYDFYLGGALVGQGRFAEAQDLSEALVTYAVDTFGDEDVRTAIAIGNLGRVYDLQGQFGPALDCFQRALAITETAVGSEDIRTVQALGNLAQVLGNLGRIDDSEVASERVLVLSRQVSGGDSVMTGQALNGLANARVNRGDYTGAEPLFEAALDILSREVGVDHPDLASTLGNLAILQRATGRHAEAEAGLRRVREIDEGMAPGHVWSAQTLYQLGRTLSETGRMEEAEELFVRAAEIIDAAEGRETPRWARMLVHRSELRERQGRVGEACEDLSAARAIFDKAGVLPEHPLHAEALVRRRRLDCAD